MDLKINPNTVVRAYNELEIRGIVMTQQGTGTFISDKEIHINEVEREKVLDSLIRPVLAKAIGYGFSVEEVLKAARDSYEERKPPEVEE